MAKESIPEEQIISDHLKQQDSISAAEEVKLFTDAVRGLPLLPLKDMLSMGVCIRCIFRLFGVSEYLCSSNTLSMPILSAAVANVIDADLLIGYNCLSTKEESSSQPSSVESELQPNFCRICLGILQFAYHDEKGISVKDCANEFAISIAEYVKLEGHLIDSFSLEVSLPAIVLEYEQAVWLYIQKEYGSEPWFLEKSMPKRNSVKDVLKLSLTGSLEKLMDVKSRNSSSFRIRLTYISGASPTTTQNSIEKSENNKRRKTDADDRITTNGCAVGGKEHSDLETSGQYDSLWSGNGLQKFKSPDLPQFWLQKVSQPCYLTFSCSRAAVYIGGRYLKYSRNVSQTRWVIDDERMGEASVEEIIGGYILPLCRGDSYKFHAAGREDIDVRMLGSGRPFLVEIQNPRVVPSEKSLKEMELKINSLEKNLVGVKNVKELGSQGWDLMREGEAEKQKQYAALVWISRSLQDEDLKTLSSFIDMPILQKTPIRVLHRRSPLERPKIIHWMKFERIGGSCQYFLLHLCTQAGTYIKEFIHGDLGRTHPSVGSILGCRAEILQLDVTDVKMDCFLTE